VRALLVASVLLIGCCEGLDGALAPPVEDEVFRDPRERVLVTEIDRGGFPDRVVDYTIEVEAITGGRREVTHGTAQVQSVHGQARAVRLGSGALGVALGDTLCVVDAHRATCTDLRTSDAASAEALWWRASDAGARTHERMRAAIALSWVDRRLGLDATDALVGYATGYDDIDAELDATRARLTRDRGLVTTLRAEIVSASAFRLSGTARACAPMLEASVRAQRARFSPEAWAYVEEGLARCASRRE
jgi:hypothetical protein